MSQVDMLTDDLSATRTEWQCGVCGGSIPTPVAVRLLGLDDPSDVPQCSHCGMFLLTLKRVEVALTAHEAMTQMRPASPALN